MRTTNFLGLVLSGLIGTAAAAHACPAPELAPNEFEIELAAGFSPNPHVDDDVIAGGPIDLSNCFNTYVGFVSESPDVDVYWSGRSPRLSFLVESNADTVILVNDPLGGWHYNDDAVSNTSNARVNIDNPPEGIYNVWLGVFGAQDVVAARVLIEE